MTQEEVSVFVQTLRSTFSELEVRRGILIAVDLC
jgi:hypothetical protein